ncbi:hypothetical protein NX059_007716 [Plenodomus lindquistii]|nr:hypothetical protein NX059_007716 [Plenodomus lindquistii]
MRRADCLCYHFVEAKEQLRMGVDHWTTPELRALFTGAPMTDNNFQTIVNEVRAIGEPYHRNIDAVRSQISTAHGKKIPMLAKLRGLAEDMRAYIDAGQPDG